MSDILDIQFAKSVTINKCIKTDLEKRRTVGNVHRLKRRAKHKSLAIDKSERSRKMDLSHVFVRKKCKFSYSGELYAAHSLGKIYLGLTASVLNKGVPVLAVIILTESVDGAVQNIFLGNFFVNRGYCSVRSNTTYILIPSQE